MRTPRIYGRALASMARLARSPVGAVALRRLLRAELRVGQLAELPESLRGDVPLDARPVQARPPRQAEDAHLPLPRAPWSGTTEQYADAYRSGRATPSQVVARALDRARELAAHSPTVGPMVEYADAIALEEAAAATARWREGRPRGPLDGVPYVVKEQTSVRGLPRQSGAAYRDRAPREEDATCVARLRAAGAIALGTTSMTELGMTTHGANIARAMPRNPHATDCVAGGSSTGAGVAVATGLVPFATGADGGGSIRVPSALNGVFGIKPTWGRVSRAGDSATDSVSHVGPIASSTLDLARALEIIAGHDPADPQTDFAPALPPGSMVGALGRGVRGLRVAIDEREWRDASPEVARACEQTLAVLEREGAKLVRVQMPLARFAPPIGYVVIASEARVAASDDWREHADEMSGDLQLAFASIDTLTATELLDAMRLRSGLRREAAGVFAEADLLALPTTAITAMRAGDAEMASSFLDTAALDAYCRYAFLANLTGLPAATAPVGKDPRGLPIGFQLVGDAWDEATVLAAIAHLERIGAAVVERPRVAVDVLP